MRITYDPQVDAAYFRFLEGEFQCQTIRLSEAIAVNIAPGGRVVGMEVLDASENLEILRDAPTIRVENLKVA